MENNFTKKNWRYSAKSVTKYNPLFRNNEGHYTKDEWIGYFQLGENVNGETLTFQEYLKVERKYILAAKLFFKLHGCENFIVKNLERKGTASYQQNDRSELVRLYDFINDGTTISVDDIDNVIKLILRELIWCELFCLHNELIAVRFGYDMYMYFNSDKEWDGITAEINRIGLFID
ncbi:MAG: hypothetical protein ABI480_13875 [Chitinophagaceae bacterium]